MFDRHSILIGLDYCIQPAIAILVNHNDLAAYISNLLAYACEKALQFLGTPARAYD
jgi:hypothetical protein